MMKALLLNLVIASPVLLNISGLTPDDGLPASADSRSTVSFQQGVNGYQGTIDTEIWALAPHTILESNPNSSTDADNDGGESQCLMRFDGIIGDAPGQIPPHAAIHSARLLVSAFDQGSTVNLHRMLVPFDRAATWSSLVSGVSADGLEASRHKDAFTFGKIAANSSEIIFDVTDTVQIWVNGNASHGWVFLNTGGNGWDFYSSEFEDVKQRPKLVVEYSLPQNSKKPSPAAAEE
ncbi:MAG: DNRLRE domain-containing protein [Planctomycetaceae bacterium]